MSKARRRRWLGGSVRVAIAAVVLGYLFSQIPVGEVLGSVAGVQVPLLLVALAVALLLQLVLADKLRRLAVGFGLRLSTREVVGINLAALCYGLFLPAGNVTGFLARLWLLSAPERNYAGAAMALALDRLIATITLCAVGIAFFLLAWPDHAWPVLGVMLLALAALLLLQVLLIMPPRRLALPFVWPAKLRSLRTALERSRSLPRSTVVWACVLGIAAHLLGTGAYALIAWALQLDLDLATVGWTRAAAILVAILPISVAGLGVREGAHVLLLAPYGVAPADALAFSLLAFAGTVVIFALAGALVEAERLVLRPLLRGPLNCRP